MYKYLFIYVFIFIFLCWHFEDIIKDQITLNKFSMNTAGRTFWERFLWAALSEKKVQKLS